MCKTVLDLILLLISLLLENMYFVKYQTGVILVSLTIIE